MDDDDRHLEVSAAPASALLATPGAARPPRADRTERAERTQHADRTEREDRADRMERPEPPRHDADIEFGWPTRLGRLSRISRIDRTKVMLALAVTVALVLAGALYLTQRQSDDERAVSAAIARYTAAWNAHDVAAVRAAMFAGTGTFAASDNITHEAMFVAGWGPDLDRVLTALFAAGVTLETRGRVMIAGDTTRASVVQRFTYTVYGLPVVEDGISQYTLSPAERGPGLKISQHVWWRPRVPASPSMLWILDAYR
jgi:hypothetical protein